MPRQKNEHIYETHLRPVHKMGARQSRYCDGVITEDSLNSYFENGEWLTPEHASCYNATRCREGDMEDRDVCITRSAIISDCSGRCPPGMRFHKWHRYGLGKVCSCVRNPSPTPEYDPIDQWIKQENLYLIGGAVILILVVITLFRPEKGRVDGLLQRT